MTASEEVSSQVDVGADRVFTEGPRTRTCPFLDCMARVRNADADQHVGYPVTLCSAASPGLVATVATSTVALAR